jgi:hypothetical protein
MNFRKKIRIVLGYQNKSGRCSPTEKTEGKKSCDTVPLTQENEEICNAKYIFQSSTGANGSAIINTRTTWFKCKNFLTYQPWYMMAVVFIILAAW